MALYQEFGSDNHAGVHPAVMQALQEANEGYCSAYGNDPYTIQAQELFQTIFGPGARTFFVFNGTAANVCALSYFTRSWQGVLCADSAHINTTECGAPEKITGAKLLTVPAVHGIITPHNLENYLQVRGNLHHSQPAVVSVTQATECGTLYTVEEIRALAAYAHKHGMFLHMDGARLANAAAAQKTDLRTMTGEAGVDVLSFSGVKNGTMFGEAVVFFHEEAASTFPYFQKQTMQLHSKMRYTAAQFIALLTSDLWRENALHANAMAALLAQEVATLPGVTVSRPVQTNTVFATLPLSAVHSLRQQYHFNLWTLDKHPATQRPEGFPATKKDPAHAKDSPEMHPAMRPEVRWMTSFQTTPTDIHTFTTALKKALQT